jgi:putative FmdB family regulatory protein
MPLFEYQCQDCGQVFEVFTQQPEPSATAKCPACGKTNVERVLSPFSRTTSSGSCSAAGPSGFG